MTLRDRIPVEPLAEDRLDRIEQRIVHRSAAALARPARPAMWPWALAATTAAATAFAVIALRRPAPAPVAPVVVATDARGTRIDVGDAVVTVGADTRFAITRPGGGVEVALDAGMVALDVAPRQGRPPLWVKAGDVGVRVVGTAFSVRRDRTLARVEVSVEHGVVEVHRGGVVSPVRAGERWSSADGVVIAMATGADGAAGAGAGSAGAGAGDGTIGATGGSGTELAGGPAIDVALLGDKRTPVAPGAGTGGAAVKPRHVGNPPGTGTGTGTGTLPEDPLGDLRARIMAQTLAPGPDAGADDPTEAARRYQAIFLSGRGADASAALYGLARTQHVQLGKHAEALKSLDAYVRRFPNGPEREAVLWMRMRILCKAGFDEPCRVAAHAYLSRYATGDRSDLAKRVTNTR